MDDRAVIEKYHGLTQIEDQFREMKGTLEARPVSAFGIENENRIYTKGDIATMKSGVKAF